MSAEQTISTGEPVDETMTQLDYVDRVLEPRDTGTQTVSALLAGLACGLGVLAVWFAPMITGFFAIGFAIIALVLAGESTRTAKIALIVATFGWLIGSILAIVTGNSSIGITL